MDSFVCFPRQTLPENIGIDEIHSQMANINSSKFLCFMNDNINRCPFEILPSRSKATLTKYFEAIPLEERKKVKYVTIDMWQPYYDVCIEYLPNVTVAVDPFHVVEHLEEAMTRVRINIMNKVEYDSDAYYLLKTWKDLLERHIYLDNEPRYNKRFGRKLNKRQLLNMMLDINDNLKLAYNINELYLDFNEKATREDCEEWFDYIFSILYECDIPEFKEFIGLLNHWKPEILNSFERPYENRKQSNALSETINSKIRTYMVVSNGLVNFVRFRKRTLYAMNPKILYAITDTLTSDKFEGKKRGNYKK